MYNDLKVVKADVDCMTSELALVGFDCLLRILLALLDICHILERSQSNSE